MNGVWNLAATAAGALLTTPHWALLTQQAISSPRIKHLTGLLAIFLPASAGMTGWEFADDPALPAWWWASVHVVPLILVDLRQHRLPRWWLASLATGGVCLFAATAAANHEPDRLGRAALAGTCMWLVMRLLQTACGGRMGGGDTRLHAVLALYTGWMSWHTVLIGFVAGSALLGITAGLACLSRCRSWSSRIAAAPSLVAGAWLALILAGR